MPILWLLALYFIVKSSYWKKFIIYLGFIFLLITSLPIVSTYIGKLLYSDNYKISNQNKKPAYVLIPGAGTWKDGYGKKYPTPESIIRARYGKELSEQFSIPLIFAGGGDAFLSSTYFADETRQVYVVEVESTNTFEIAKN